MAGISLFLVTCRRQMGVGSRGTMTTMAIFQDTILRLMPIAGLAAVVVFVCWQSDRDARRDRRK
jgi:hypothetical protein